MPYLYTASSASTWTIVPAITSGTDTSGNTWMITAGSITSGQITAGSIFSPTWNYGTGGYALEPGWQWGWNQLPAVQPAPYQPMSREELDRLLDQERTAAEERRAVRMAEHQAARARIAGRAEALLASLLDEDQFRSYLSQGWFEVTGSAGGRYRIRRDGQAGNIDELAAAGDDRVASLCIHPYGGFHDADAHAAQYLALVTDEPGFRRTANRTPRRRLRAA